MTRFDMWKSSAKGCPNDLTTCDDLTHSSSKWPCISRSNASSGAGATSTPVRTPNLPRLTAALPQGEQMLAISMKKMWKIVNCEMDIWWYCDINGCTKLNLDLNLDKFDTFTWPEGLRWSSSAGMTLEILRVLEFLRLSFSSQGTLKDCANASNASNASQILIITTVGGRATSDFSRSAWWGQENAAKTIAAFSAHIFIYIYIIYIICTKKNHVHLLVQTKFMQKCPKLNIAMIINDYQWPSMVFNYQQDRVIQVHTSSYKFIQLPLDFHTFPCLSHVCRLLSRGSSHKVHEARGEVIDGTWRANGSNGHLWGPNHDLTCYSRGDMGWLSYMGL